jgi:ABC-type bacteriocin/lantibiotic exporter with double-glycine peptidase domain
MTQFLIGYIRGSKESDVQKEKREKHDKRMSYINESFHNIKGVKLYGWESKFLDKIEKVY